MHGANIAHRNPTTNVQITDVQNKRCSPMKKQLLMPCCINVKQSRRSSPAAVELNPNGVTAHCN
jgi:hypothetical protein